eukprot:9189052-Pyramimonas_sp.AAC.1
MSPYRNLNGELKTNLLEIASQVRKHAGKLASLSSLVELPDFISDGTRAKNIPGGNYRIISDGTRVENIPGGNYRIISDGTRAKNIPGGNYRIISDGTRVENIPGGNYR